MHNHIEETFASVVGFFAYIFAHYTGLNYMLQVSAQPVNLTDKFVNVLFGVATAIIAYFAVYGIKKFITHEEIKTTNKKK